MTIRRLFGMQVYKLRIRKGLTQGKLAERSGISLQYLQNLESKSPKSPSIDTIEKLANGLEVEPWQLLKF